MYARLISVLVAALLLFACGPIDTMKEGFAHSEAVSASLEKSLGVKNVVGFNWNNGSLTSVTVTFEGIPASSTLPEIVARSKQTVVAEFKQTPSQIVVAFAVEP